MSAAVVDSHLHFWDLSLYRRTDWLEDKPSLLKNFLPHDVKPEFDRCGVDLGIVVEAAKEFDSSNLWWLDLARECAYLGAVVAGCHLEQKNLADWLDRYGAYREFVGVRATPRGIPAEWPDNIEARRALSELSRRDLSLDLLLHYPEFYGVEPLAAEFPELRIIVNHCGHIPLDRASRAAWRAALEPLSRFSNIYVKYSSLLMNSQAAMPEEELTSHVSFLFDSFGPERMIWGSNWPVELLWGSYEESWDLSHRCLPGLSESETEGVFGGNALRAYRIPLGR